jgi:hypothetical protein
MRGRDFNSRFALLAGGSAYQLSAMKENLSMVPLFVRHYPRRPKARDPRSKATGGLSYTPAGWARRSVGDPDA